MINRWRRWMLPVMVGFVIAGIAVVGRESGLARRSADFTIAYSAALLIREGRAEDVYRPDQLGPLMLRLSDSAIDPRLPFDAPLLSAPGAATPGAWLFWEVCCWRSSRSICRPT